MSACACAAPSLPHPTQSCQPGVLLYVLIGQAEHAAPEPAVKEPAGQGRQLELLGLPVAAVYVPAGQEMHPTLPALLAYALSGHGVHCTDVLVPSPL